MTGMATSNYFGEMCKVLLALGAVVALIVLLARYLPRLLRSSNYFKQDQSSISIKQRVVLGPRKQVVLIQKDNIELLLGVTDNQINLIKDFGPTREAEADDSTGYPVLEVHE